MLLNVNGIDVFYGKVQALFDVSFQVEENEIVSIIGANGAGKTTLMKTIMGINKPRKGSIEYNGRLISGQPVHKVVQNEIVYVPEGREIFMGMTVRENLLMGAYSRRYTKAQMEEHLEQMHAMFPRLKEREKQLAGSMSGGEQQMLAIARGLMSRPRLIMFDEPSLGLAPIIVSDVFETIQRIRSERGIPIVLVEQNAYKALRISDRGYILENGKITLQGSSDDLINNDQVKKAYLGG